MLQLWILLHGNFLKIKHMSQLWILLHFLKIKRMRILCHQ